MFGRVDELIIDDATFLIFWLGFFDIAELKIELISMPFKDTLFSTPIVFFFWDRLLAS